jgi:DNA-binding NtrC family response regulator
MIVDDEPIVGKRLKRLFEKDGYAVEIFTRGSLALKEIENRKFDIIITDLKMGKVDGMQILETAREKYPDIKIIIISGLSKNSLVIDALKKGAFSFIVKPFKFNELKEVVCRAHRELRDIEN